MDPQPISGVTRKSQDIQRAELERKSRDLWRVFNPTNQDFPVILNAAISPEVWTVKAKSESIVPYYVAIKFWEEMTDRIIITKSDKLVVEENEKRMEKGFERMNLHTEQMRFESRNLKVMMSKREQILKALNRGLYKEYGIDGLTGRNPSTKFDKSNFDSGIDVLGGPARSVVNPTPTGEDFEEEEDDKKEPPEVKEPVGTRVEEEDDGTDVVEEKKVDGRIAALEKARAAKIAKKEGEQIERLG